MTASVADPLTFVHSQEVTFFSTVSEISSEIPSLEYDDVGLKNNRYKIQTIDKPRIIITFCGNSFDNS